MRINPPRTRLLLVAVAWLSGVAIGLATMLNYETKPGSQAASPDRWPSDTQIPRVSSLPVVIMFAHPRCPCTRASIDELAKLMTHLRGRASAYVLIVKPGGISAERENTDLWGRAAAIPGVTVISDPEGQEASRFQALTSGQTLLYNAQGHRLFSGGITPSRGQSGDNAGRSAIMSFVVSGATERTKTPVFGCLLLDPDPKTLEPNPQWTK